MTSSTDDSRAASSAPRGTSNGTRASASVRLARTMRCATVGSGTRKARAISSVVRPPSRRKRQRHARLRREHRMTGGEHEAQQVVADVVVDRRVEIGRRHLRSALDLVTELLVLALEPLAPAQLVDRAVLRGRPSAKRPGCPERPTPATARARRPARPARALRQAPTSRTMRASPAMILADSILQTAWMARWVSEAVTATV